MIFQRQIPTLRREVEEMFIGVVVTARSISQESIGGLKSAITIANHLYQVSNNKSKLNYYITVE